jgi:hypothetical protein
MMSRRERFRTIEEARDAISRGAMVAAFVALLLFVWRCSCTSLISRNKIHVATRSHAANSASDRFMFMAQLRASYRAAAWSDLSTTAATQSRTCDRIATDGVARAASIAGTPARPRQFRARPAMAAAHSRCR